MLLNYRYYSSLDSQKLYEENIVIKTILNRKSVRQFSEKKVEKAKIDLLLRAGMSAPSARNRQPWKFIVVDEKDLLKTLGMELPYARMLINAPLGIVVCGDIRNKEDRTAQSFWIQDCAATVENILIAVEALGLGAVWTGCYPRQERADTVIKHLNIPEGIIPLCVIPIGYPKFNTSTMDKWREENIIYNKWE